MNIKFVYITYFLICAYLVSAYLFFWLEINTHWPFHLFYLPLAIFLAVIFFGSVLKGKLAIIFKIAAAAILFCGAFFTIYTLSNCTGLGCISLLFLAPILLGLTLVIYIFYMRFKGLKKLKKLPKFIPPVNAPLGKV